MKNTILFLLLIYTLSLCSQTGVVTYKVENKIESKSERVKKIKEELSLIEFSLNYNKDKSYFKKEKNIPKNQLMANIAVVLVGAFNDFVQYNNTKEALHNDEIRNTNYQVDHSHKMTGWKLTNETTTINDFICYKAILTEYNNGSETYFDTVAWFTPSIPVGYGPIGYGGLPGLILQLEYNKAVYTADKITLNPKKINIENIKSGKKISIKELVTLKRNARKVTED